MEEITTLARRTLYDVAFAAVVGASHLERARNRAVVKVDAWIGSIDRDHCALPGCDGLMVRDRPTRRLSWRVCASCGKSAVGEPVEDAA